MLATATDSTMATAVRLLVCPDDWGSLAWFRGALVCCSCGRTFRFSRANILDMLPRRPLPAGTEPYWLSYRACFAKSMESGDAKLPWGASQQMPPVVLARKRKHLGLVRRLIERPAGPQPRVFCDLTGGSGHYTLAYAPDFDYVLHCDLDPASLSYTAAKAARLGLHNILFVRIDYLQPPFHASLERLICLDTLERGPEHELLLLSAIRRMLSRDGVAVVDFHHWWHNPLRRLGLLGENFRHNTSYGLGAARELLRASGFTRPEYTPFRQEFCAGPARAWHRLLPPTRLLFRLQA